MILQALAAAEAVLRSAEEAAGLDPDDPLVKAAIVAVVAAGGAGLVW